MNLKINLKKKALLGLLGTLLILSPGCSKAAESDSPSTGINEITEFSDTSQWGEAVEIPGTSFKLKHNGFEFDVSAGGIKKGDLTIYTSSTTAEGGLPINKENASLWLAISTEEDPNATIESLEGETGLYWLVISKKTDSLIYPHIRSYVTTVGTATYSIYLMRSTAPTAEQIKEVSTIVYTVIPNNS